MITDKQSMLKIVSRLVLALSLCIASLSCTPPDLTANMKMKEGSPPVFEFSGTGQMYSLEFGRLKYDKLGGTNTIDLLWEIAPSADNHDLTMSDYPPVIYGKLPAGFIQTFPKHGNAPKLIEGQTYSVWPCVLYVGTSSLDFKIEEGRAVLAN